MLTCWAGQELSPWCCGAQAVMSRKDAGLFLHATNLFCPLCFPPLSKALLPAAHCFGSCVHSTISAGRSGPQPFPRLAAAGSSGNPSHLLRPCCCLAGSDYESSLLRKPREGGLLCGGAFLTLSAAGMRLTMGVDWCLMVIRLETGCGILALFILSSDCKVTKTSIRLESNVGGLCVECALQMLFSRWFAKHLRASMTTFLPLVFSKS